MISPGNSILSVILELLIQPLDTAFGKIHDETDHFNKIFVQKYIHNFHHKEYFNKNCRYCLNKTYIILNEF
ncbi:hypothetical protein D9V35_03785 [Commensalibacter melissae]|nr:hypothetical protein D9V35_03785 [Commensalibacter melissae]